MGGLGAGFLGRFTHQNHLADSLLTGPLMLFFEPFHLGGNRRRTRFDVP